MASTLTDIADRLTPSSPIEVTYGSQPIAAGAKNTTLIGHGAQAPGAGILHEVYNVTSIGDPDAAQAEVDLLAGAGSELGKMAYAFVAANSLAGRSNFPAFSVLILAFGESPIPLDAIQSLKSHRSDMIVSCFPAGDTANTNLIINAAIAMSGVDRDLNGQFGSFVTAASLESQAAQEAYNYNQRSLLVASLPDSCNDVFDLSATLTQGSPVVPYVPTPAVPPSPGSPEIQAVPEAHFLQVDVSNLQGGTFVLGYTEGNLVPVPAQNLEVHLLQALQAYFPGVIVNPHAGATGFDIVYPADFGAVDIPAIFSNDLTTPQGTVANLQISESTPFVAGQDAGPTGPGENATGTIYLGAKVSGGGVLGGTTVIAVSGNSFTMSAPATLSGTKDLQITNVVSQPESIVAAAHAGGMMSSAQPYNPLQGVVIGGLIAPKKRSDRVSLDPNGASEAMLKAGLSPLTVQPGEKVAFVRTRVSLVFLPDGVTRYTNYIDWQQIVPLYDFREVLYQVTQNPPFNNNPGGTKASAQNLALFGDEVLREANEFEKIGMFQNVKLLAKYFQSNIPSPGRFDVKIPVDAVPGLYVMAANIEAISDALNFTI